MKSITNLFKKALNNTNDFEIRPKSIKKSEIEGFNMLSSVIYCLMYGTDILKAMKPSGQHIYWD